MHLAMAIGVSLVYLVMVATMGSLRDPFIVVLSMPLAIVGALVALFVTGGALSLPAMMGFLFLIGIVVTNAIVLLTFVNQLRAQGYDALEAVIEAGRTRLRPILMTAFTTILAIFPLAFSDAGGIVSAELGHRGHRWPDQLHIPHAGRRSRHLYAAPRVHSEPVPAGLLADRPPPGARSKPGCRLTSPLQSNEAVN